MTINKKQNENNGHNNENERITIEDRQIIMDAIAFAKQNPGTTPDTLVSEASKRISACIRYSIRNDIVTQQSIANTIGKNSSTIGRRLEKNIEFDIKEIDDLYNFLFVEKNIIFRKALHDISNTKDALYFAIMSFFDIKSPSQLNAIDLITGTGSATYQLWRYSVEDDSEFVHGRINFHVDEKNGALHAKMFQPKRNQDPSTEQSPKENADQDAIDGTPHPLKGPWIRPSSEKFEGYFFRIADMYMMILKDMANNDIRISIFPNYRIERIDHKIVKDSVLPEGHKQIVHMDGFGLGIDGNNLFFSPVHMDLVDSKCEEDVLDSKLDVVSEEAIPKRIVKKLKRYPLIRK